MSERELYLAIAGLIGALISLYLWGRKIGHNNINCKHYVVVSIIFLFPTVILPIWFDSKLPLVFKIIITFSAILMGVLRYIITTKSQEDVSKLLAKK